LLRRFVWELYFQEHRQTKIPKFMSDVAALLIFVVMLILVLSFIYEVKVPGLLAGSGIAAVILGLAMQDTLGNIISGFSLHFGKPYQPGDWLIVDNRHVEVMEINWRSTRLRTNDQVYLDVPNSQITKQTIVNLTYPTRLHAMRLQVGIDYRTPPNVVKEALLRATASAQGVLPEPRPKVFLHQFGDSAITYEVKFWMEDHARYNEIVDAIRTNVWYELQRQQITIPFPIRTVQIQKAAEEEPTRDQSALRLVLSQQTVFQCLDERQLDRLIAQARRCQFGRGEKLIEQGQAGDSMFVLARGEANVIVQRNGEPTVVAVLKAGDCFGEMSLLTGERRSATVVAQTDCEVAEIEKASLQEILQAQPQLLNRLSELLAQRQMATEGILASRSADQTPTAIKRDYVTNFLTKLQSFFEL
jgi:small-conductance mechanosensitive channel/CRP-like cAMP-binding protein